MTDRLTATCPACKDVALLAERIIVCDGCEAIYHDACWKKNGGRCLDAACTGSVATAPVPAPPVEEPVKPGPRKGLAMRIQTASLSPEGLSLNLSVGGKVIPWEDVELLGLGIIELDLTIDVPRGAMRAMLQKLMGNDSQPNQQRRSVRETYLLDIFVKNAETPLRVDSTSVNYRSLLGEASHQSMRNFLRLLQKIASFTPNCRLDPSTAALLAGRRLDVKRYTSVYEFEMEMHINRSRLSEMVLCSTVDVRNAPPVEWNDEGNEEGPAGPPQLPGES